MIEHAIPQNIMDYEFRLFAGLTIKQFIIVAVTGGLAFGLVELSRMGIFPTPFAWVIVPTVLLSGLALGLGSYEKRSLDQWVTDYIQAINMPLRRVWKKGPEAVKNENFGNSKVPSFPTYLSVYFLSEDEYRKLMQFTPNATPVTQQQTFIAPIIQLTADVLPQYTDASITLPMVPNTIAFRLIQDEIPMDNVICYVKDMNETVIAALRSNEEGILYFDQSFPNGIYTFEFQDDTVQLPRMQISFEGFTYPLINVTPLE